MDTVLNGWQCDPISLKRRTEGFRFLDDPSFVIWAQVFSPSDLNVGWKAVCLVAPLYQLYPAGGDLSSLLLSRENGGMRMSKCEPSVRSIRNVPLCEKRQLWTFIHTDKSHLFTCIKQTRIGSLSDMRHIKTDQNKNEKITRDICKWHDICSNIFTWKKKGCKTTSS